MNVAAFLDEQGCAYAVMQHPTTYTAQEMAHELHVPGREVAKTVLLHDKTGNEFVVAMVPAHKRVDLESASRLVGANRLELASEAEVAKQCPDCELGALPPFGSRYGMKTIVDESLVDDEEIVFEANTHEEAIRMRFDEFRRLEKPLVAKFAV